MGPFRIKKPHLSHSLSHINYLHAIDFLFFSVCFARSECLERKLVQGDSQLRRTGKASVLCCLVSMPMSAICGVSCCGLGLVLKFMPRVRATCNMKGTKDNSDTCTE